MTAMTRIRPIEMGLIRARKQQQKAPLFVALFRRQSDQMARLCEHTLRVNHCIMEECAVFQLLILRTSACCQ